MADAVLDRMLNELRSLESAELARLEEAIRARRRQAAHAAEDDEPFRQALLASGLVNEVRRRPMLEEDDTPLIQVEGEPLSETIIRERR